MQQLTNTSLAPLGQAQASSSFLSTRYKEEGEMASLSCL